MKLRTLLLLAVPLALACSDLTLDPPKDIVHARFDPDDKAIPMPTNILRDGEAGLLDLPVDDDDVTPTELEFYEFLNQTDGWSTTMPASVEFTAPIDPDTVTPDTLQVWLWRGVPQRVEDAKVSIDPDEMKIVIDAPREGWERGGTYVVLMRGGDAGVEGKGGESVECDAAFYFLRQTEKLDTPEHERAFPGDTRAERQDNADQLEEARVQLAPYFEYFENNGIPRTEVAALWEFTITERTELAIDRVSQRVPLPSNLILDPATGLVELPGADWDSEAEAEAKHRLRDSDGFALSARLLFEFTAPMNPATIDNDSVRLYELGDTPIELSADISLMDDLIHVIVEPHALPLKEVTDYAVVVNRSVRDAAGNKVVPMYAGHFLKSETPVFANGSSEAGPVEDEDAEKLEFVRLQIISLLDRIGRDDVVAAWPFTTMSVRPALDEAVIAAETLDVPFEPSHIEHMTPGAALLDFALGIGSLFQVEHVYNGTIPSPVFLDDRTRSWREDGGHEIRDIGFTMTVPRNVEPGTPVPVVIFGHGVMSERRFVLAIGDALAARGFAAIAIDFPLHGTRTHCLHGGPLSLIDPATGELTSAEPCANGTTCAEDGRCVDESDQGNDLATWPIIGMPVASGAAFIEIDHIANTRDHFKQTVVDLGALERSLRKADWNAAVGIDVDTDHIYYAGQSLGGIIGATFVTVSPGIKRAVLNVPGADTVDLFTNSTVFGPQVEAFFTREDVELGSFEQERFMNVARWFMDAVDPQSVAHQLTVGRDVLIQMATLDFIILNDYTRVLEDLSGAPRRDYIGEHVFLVLPIEPAYLRGVNDLADFLAEEL